MKTVLITGGAGFIGSHLADKLLKKQDKIIVADNFNDFYSPVLKEDNVTHNLSHENYNLYRVDIENKQSLEQIFADNSIDIIVHLAARAGVRPSIERPLDYVATNILGTMNILELMNKYHVKKMIFASSSSVYGNCEADTFHEDLIITKPISPYAATKSACEQICYTYHHLYGLQVICLRFFTVYGPRQRPDLAIRKFIEKIKAGLPIDMYGDGSSMRDYTYIADITDGIISAINYEKTAYEIINIGGGQPITLKNMIKTIEICLNKDATIKQCPMQPGDVDKTVVDISRAKELFGYTPKMSFRDGVLSLIEWVDINIRTGT